MSTQDTEILVFVLAHHLIDELRTRRALLADEAALAHAGIHQKAEGEGKVGLPGEVANRLRMFVLFQREVVLLQVANDRSVLVAHGGENVDHLDAGGIRGALAGAQKADPDPELLGAGGG